MISWYMLIDSPFTCGLGLSVVLVIHWLHDGGILTLRQRDLALFFTLGTTLLLV